MPFMRVSYGGYDMVVQCDAISDIATLCLAIKDRLYILLKKNFVVLVVFDQADGTPYHAEGWFRIALASYENPMTGHAWILGVPFIQSYCVVCDFGRERLRSEEKIIYHRIRKYCMTGGKK
ncbi:hypothetical protein L596_019550 [Steinernema carpocapsae]|uniref:Uncharacterized protein n=1 Tax=Steinernema carpocapsae TaxID=34508 RepID=A0A4U5MQV2_STECR|nr:hypothetical protein L596_019545 [Steinernema carpocapsae]TKR72027.1 hypothetical protein L596_019550 [Steinernema carpocapsae]